MWKNLVRGQKPNFLKIDSDRWIDPEDIQFLPPEEIEKRRMQQLSQQERMMEERYKQVLNDEGKSNIWYNYKRKFKIINSRQLNRIEKLGNDSIYSVILLPCF